MEYMYAVPGMNVDKCKCGGSVFHSVTLNEFHQITMVGAKKKLGRCHRCNRQHLTEFRRRLGPSLEDEGSPIQTNAKVG
jgi:hypothetical protein